MKSWLKSYLLTGASFERIEKEVHRKTRNRNLRIVSWVAGICLIIGLIAGYAWRMAQVDPGYRQDVLYLLTYIRDKEDHIKALKMRLANAEGKAGEKIARKGTR